MRICENCPFKEEAELYCDGEQMMKICKYSAMCERVLEQCIHSQAVWETMNENTEFLSN